MLRPLPFHDPARLLWIGPEVFNGNWSAATYSIDAYTELRERNKSYTDVAGYYAFSSSDNFKLTGHGDPRPFTGIGVTPDFFQVLGVDPLMGRLFHENESLPGAGQVILLSYPIWQRQFHGDPSILGRTVDFNDRSFTVVGILPRSFDFGAVFAPGTRVDLFVPIDFKGTRLDGNTITLIGRLKPGVTVGAGARRSQHCSSPNSTSGPTILSTRQDTPPTPHHSRNTSAASSIVRLSSSGPPSASCCSSSASISPICCSPAPPHAARSSHCAAHSAPAAAASCVSCSRKAFCSPA